MTKKLSKSKILSGLQCEKKLWLEIHQPDLAVVPEDAQRRFDAGHEVNDVARSLYENGHLIEFDEGSSGALAETEKMLRDAPETPLFEATFAHGGVMVRVDILKKNARGYRLIEVKSSTSVKVFPHHDDCAVQAWVLEGCGLSLDRVELAHINNQFVYGGDGDYRGLLRHENLTNDIVKQKQEVPEWVNKFQGMLEGEQPNIAVGKHCNEPYPCPFIEHCTGPSTDYPVTCLPRGGKTAEELTKEGITDIRDIPPGRLENESHIWVREVTIKGKPEIKPAVKKILGDCSWPRYYLDFETVSFAVPIWKDTRPYQKHPFQWSCHVETKPGEVTHKEFLDTTGNPPMREFTESLLQAVGQSGAIFVYSWFEKVCLEELAALFPELKSAVEKVIHRLVDLHPLTRRHYYHPDMRGSWSLKAVLPTIAPDLDYGGLGEIQDGGAAEVAYLEITHPGTEPKRAQALAADLRAYCKRDTEALVELVRVLSTGKSR